MKKGRKKSFGVFIQRLSLLVMMLLFLPFISETTYQVCIDFVEDCTYCEADLESESETENSRSSSIDDDYLSSISTLLFRSDERSLMSSFAFTIKNRITKDDPSPPPETTTILV